MAIDSVALREKYEKKLKLKVDHFTTKEKELDENRRNGKISGSIYEQGRRDLLLVQNEIIELKQKIAEL